VRKIFKELFLVFLSGIIGVTVWYYVNDQEMTYLHLLTHYAIPIQIIATIFFYILIFLLKKVNVY
jgi:hypothetical protein